MLRQTETSASTAFIEPIIRVVYYNNGVQNELYRID